MKNKLTDEEYAAETSKHENALRTAIDTIKLTENPAEVRAQLLVMHTSIHGIAQARLALIEEHTHPRKPLELKLNSNI